MRRLTAVIVVSLMVAGMAGPSYAAMRADRGSLRGEVVDVDFTRNEITILHGGKEHSFKAKKPIGRNIQRGTGVIIIYEKKSGLATFVSPIKRRGR